MSRRPPTENYVSLPIVPLGRGVEPDLMAGTRPIDHLLRRAGFGASPADLAVYDGLSFTQAVDRFVDYERQPDDVDGKVGTSGYLGVTTRGGNTAWPRVAACSASASRKRRPAWRVGTTTSHDERFNGPAPVHSRASQATACGSNGAAQGKK